MIDQVKGTNSLYKERANKFLFVQSSFLNHFNMYGYKYLQTPILEHKELFNKSIGENSEIVTKQMYEFKDRSGRDIVLRPEGTSSVVRYHSEFQKDFTNQYIYFGQMYRYENPQKNRYREFFQAGAEIVGKVDIFSDFQIINDSLNFLNSLDMTTNLRINTIGSIDDREKYIKVLLKFFNDNKKHLSKDSKEKLNNNTLRILDSNEDQDKEIISKAPKITDFVNKFSLAQFNDLKELFITNDIKFTVDEKIVRGLDYYNDLTFEILDKDNLVIGGGGRYDNLSKILKLGNFNGVGVAFGVERLMNSVVLPKFNYNIYLLGTNVEKLALYSKILDKYNIPYVKSSRLSKINNQFKEAKKQNVKYVVNTDEDTIKNLINNSVEKFSIEVLIEN